MVLLRKSIIRKLFLNLFLFSLLIVTIYYYFFRTGNLAIPYEYFVATLFVFLIFFLLVYWFDVLRPLRPIMTQIQALLAGKPYKRIYTERIDEIGMIAHFFNQVTKGLGKVSFDLKDRERMLDELTIAAQLQRDILPLKNPSVNGLKIIAKTKPATEVGGDSFDIISVKNRTYIYMGDVTGHGVAAGLIMTMVNSLVSIFANIYVSAYEIMVNVNKYIKKHVKKSMFMTMVMLSWDQDKKEMTFVGAGHEYILVYRPDSGICEAIMSGGVAIGMVGDNSKVISEKKIELRDGDFVLLYSDGITEARNKDGELYGIERLKQAFKEFAAEYSAEGVNFHIAKDVSNFMRGHDQLDDMTLIVMQVNSQAKIAADSELKSTEW